MKLLWAILTTLWFAALGAVGQEVAPDLPSSLSTTTPTTAALQELVYDLGEGEERTHVYVEPNVTQFYNAAAATNTNTTCPASTKTTPKFNGFAAKFLNLSPRTVRLYWQTKAGGPKSLIGEMPPMQASGTASFPRHRFILVDAADESHEVASFVMQAQQNVYAYDAIRDEDPAVELANLQALTDNQRSLYERLRATLTFGEAYQNVTGRGYLANYRRPAPRVFMWPADHFGQEHWVTTAETQFVAVPPVAALEAATTGRQGELSHTPVLMDYRQGSRTDATTNDDPPLLNLTLKVLSCAPRVYEIQNFLSATEVAHLLDLAGAEELKRSETGGSQTAADKSTNTRTSFQSWLYREKSPVVDAIYRRAADVERIDEGLMRKRQPGERPDVEGLRSYAEPLQLVHYAVGQEYTSHHDFGYSTLHKKSQSVRYTTLLMYLNEGMEGGETTFPRWSNAETFHELRVKPEVGKAVLFYSQLEDGNLDDLSQHAAKPVQEGEKWLINLWFSNPVYYDDEY